jgi:hypothetical protein
VNVVSSSVPEDCHRCSQVLMGHIPMGG